MASAGQGVDIFISVDQPETIQSIVFAVCSPRRVARRCCCGPLRAASIPDITGDTGHKKKHKKRYGGVDKPIANVDNITRLRDEEPRK